MATSEGLVVVAVAASAGGIPALEEMLSSLPGGTPAAFLIIQHLSPDHPSRLSEILRRFTPMVTEEAHDGDELRHGLILVAPPGHHMVVTPAGTIALKDTPKIHFVRPSADVLFESVADAFGPRAIAVVLSGTGTDGARGVEMIKRRGGKVLVQQDGDEKFCDGMPSAAIRTGAVDAVLSAGRIGPAIDALAMQLKPL